MYVLKVYEIKNIINRFNKMHKPYSDVINLYIVLNIYVCNAVWIIMGNKYNAEKCLFQCNGFLKNDTIGKYMQPHFFIKTLQLPFDFLINFGFLSVKLKRHKSARYKQCNKNFINSNFLLSSMFNFFCGFLGCLISICNIFYILFYL